MSGSGSQRHARVRHDVHITNLIGVAKILAALKDQWHGTLILIGQPAEETVDGAKAMLADGLYTRFPKPILRLDYTTAQTLRPAKSYMLPGTRWRAQPQSI